MSAKEARRNQTIAEVELLIHDFTQWKELRLDQKVAQTGDPRRQYDSQLEALGTEVLGAAALLRSHVVDAVPLDRTAGEIYAECARTEDELLWLWRVWGYFRDKFDQRQDDRFTAVLLAADEVVWSCYRPFFRTLVSGRVPEPAPLPYIETDFAPSALRRSQKEVLARRGPDFTLLVGAFRQLPVPILKIPITTVSNPWSLVLIGHETGHIVQSAVAPKFVETFAASLAAVVPEEDREYWSDWSPEIFADWYALSTMGHWALWALAQYEQAERATLVERRSKYPAVLVRLELVRQLADCYGLPAEDPLTDLGMSLATAEGDPAELFRDMKSVPAVVAAIMTLPELKALVTPLQFDKRRYAKGGEVQQWSEHLTSQGALPPNKNVRSARMAAAGLAYAWNQTVIVPDTAPDWEQLAALRDRGLGAITAAAEPSVRAAVDTPGTGRAPGVTLLEFLRAADVSR
jgi:hypothetical protein